MRAVVLLLLAIAPAYAAEEAQPMPADRLETRLGAVEQALKDIAEGRHDLEKGLREMLAEKKIAAKDMVTMCNVAGDQSELLLKIGKVITTLESPVNQATMSPEQLERLAKVRSLADSTPPKMDCAATLGG